MHVHRVAKGLDCHCFAARNLRTAGLFIALSLLSFCIASVAQTVRVGFYENAPKLYTNEAGRIVGFFPAIIETIAEQEGWTLEYVSGTWSECLVRLEAGEIDLMPDVGYSEQRATIYGFAEEPLFINWGIIYTVPDSGIESIPDLVGKRIAVMKGSIHTEGEQGIKAMLSQFDIRSTYVEVSNYTAVFEALQAGEADAGAVNRLFGLATEKMYDVRQTPIVFNPRELRFAYPIGSEFGAQLAEKVDQRVGEMKADPESVYYRSIETYLLGAAPDFMQRLPRWLPWLLGGGGAIIIGSVLTILLLRRRQRLLSTELEASEIQFETMFEKAAVGIAILKPREGRFLRANPRLCEMMGYKESELQRLHVDAIFHPEDQGRHAPAVRDVLEGRSERLVSEERLIRKDGSTLWGAITRSMVATPSGEPVYGIAVVQDISARKEAERVLQAERDRAQRYLDIAGVIIVALNADETVRMINERGCETLGLPQQDIVGSNWFDHFVPEADRNRTREGFRRLIDGDIEPVEYFDNLIKDSTGQERLIAWHNAVLRDSDGTITGTLSSGQDITERRRAEEALQESEERLKEAQTIARLGHWVLDLESKTLVWSDEIYRIFGETPQSFEPTFECFLMKVHPDDKDRVNAAWAAAMKGGAYDIEHRIIVEDSIRWVRERAQMEYAEDGRAVRGVGIVADITEPREAEISQRESEERLRSVIEQSIDGIALVDSDGSIVEWNQGQVDITGIPTDQALGRPFWDVQYETVPDTKRAPQLLDILREATQTMLQGEDSPWAGRFLDQEIQRLDGELRTIQIGSFPIDLGERRMLGSVTRDITDQKRSEDALRESEKRFRSVIEQSIDGLVLTGSDGRILEWNKGQELITGIPTQDAVGQLSWDVQFRLLPAPSEMSSSDLLSRLRMTTLKLLVGDESQHGLQLRELEIERPDGSRRVVEIGSFPIDLGQSSILGSVVRDITDQKITEKELEEHRENLERLVEERTDALNTAVEAAKAAMFRLNLITNEVERDERWFEIAGITNDQFDGTHETWRQLVHPDDLSSAEASIADAVASGRDALRHEYRIIRPDGEMRHIETRARIIRDEKGKATALVGMNIDITERRRADEALRENEAFMRSMIEQMPIDFFAVDRDLRYIMQSPTSKAAIGDVVGKKISEADVPAAQKELWISEHSQVLEGRSLREENEIVAQDGEVHTYLSEIAPVYDGEQIIASIGTSMDITDRKRSEERIRQLSRVIEESPVSVVITDVKGTIEYVNPRFSEVTGYISEEAIGQNPRMLKSGDQSTEFYKELWDTILAGRNWRGEFCNKKKTGELFWELASISPIRDEDGVITHFVAIKEDITERKHIAWDLEQTKRDAEAANQAKSDFLANMSHELRTPLNAVIGFSEVLEDGTFGELNDKQSKYVGNILQSGRHLLSLINDILDLSKVEAGKMELEVGDVDVSRLIFESLIFVQEKAHQHCIGLETSLSEDVSRLTIQADERKLKQVLFNLLSNATKFTPDDGSITLSAELADEELLVRVQDTGIGLKPEDLHRVFDEFEQIDSSYAKTQQGTGLGLALTKRLVEMHGGRIWAESEGEGRGSTFTFTLPLTSSDGSEGS